MTVKFPLSQLFSKYRHSSARLVLLSFIQDGFVIDGVEYHNTTLRTNGQEYS
jgi:hypothetical protein